MGSCVVGDRILFISQARLSHPSKGVTLPLRVSINEHMKVLIRSLSVQKYFCFSLCGYAF
jgi:hypothetical protein